VLSAAFFYFPAIFHNAGAALRSCVFPCKYFHDVTALKYEAEKRIAFCSFLRRVYRSRVM